MLGAWSFLEDSPTHILDIGSGTGVISLMQAQKFKKAEIHAAEIEIKAYNETKFNFEVSPWGNRLTALNCNYLSHFFNCFYDLVLTNPPFYSNSFSSSSEKRNFARQEKFLPFEDLFEKTRKIISPRGNFQLIVPVVAEEKILNLAQKNNFHLNRICRVQGSPFSPIKRILFSFSKIPKKFSEEVLIIEKERGLYTENYKALTQEFYLNF